MPEGMEKLLRGPGSGLESRGGVLGERDGEGALQMESMHRVGTTRDLGQRKEIGRSQCELLFTEMGTSIESIAAEN